MSRRVLNPILYQALQRIFGDVEVANAGNGAKLYPQQKLTRRGLKMVTTISKGAEHYCVKCRFCGDRKPRLWVNHRYGTPDLITGNAMQFMASCFNEDCLSDADNMRRFQDELEEAMAGRAMVLRTPEVEDADRVTTQVLPGVTRLLTELPATHPAVMYLKGRGYDIKALSKFYDIRAIVEPPEGKAFLIDHIVIPIRMQRDLVGWQARYPADLDWKATGARKYYNLPGMPKRLFLYNYDTARRYRMVVVVEGVTSVWRMGGPVVAIFGKSLSEQQRRMLLEWELVVFMLDNDDESAQQKMLAMHADISRHRPSCMVVLPESTDPAQFPRKVLWEAVTESVQTAGYQLDLKVVK